MVKSRAWNWEAVSSPIWSEVAPEAYPVVLRWKSDGRLRVLDLGCGLGRHSLLLAGMGFLVSATDLSAAGTARLAEAASRDGLAVQVSVADMRALPYTPDSFDAVLAFHVIYHTDRRGLEETLEEIRRVLRTGGEVFVTFNSRENPSYRRLDNQHIEDGTMVKTSGEEEGIPHHYVDAAEIRELLVGFTVIRMTHLEEYLDGDERSCHYFVLARKD